MLGFLTCRRRKRLSIISSFITDCYYEYLLQIGLPVDQVGPHLRCLCSDDVGGDCSIHSPADIHDEL